MEISLMISEDIFFRLQGRARIMQCSLEDAALRLLDDALENKGAEDHLQEVIQKIQSHPPNPENIRPARESLERMLATIPDDPDFDPEKWDHQWDAMESKMRKIDWENDMAEGQG